MPQNNRYESQLFSQANLQNQFYNYDEIQPCSLFWKQLCVGNETPTCLVPDTLIINEKDSQLSWVYTDKKGALRRDTGVALKDFINKVTNYCSPNELVAVIKRPVHSEHLRISNDLKLVNSRFLHNFAVAHLKEKEQIVAIQKFVKSKGPKAFLFRTLWKRGTACEAFMITNKNSFTNEEIPESKRMLAKCSQQLANIVKSTQAKCLSYTSDCLAKIVKYFQFKRGILLDELIGDFIKDEADNWWLVNIKAFKLGLQSVKKVLETDNEKQLTKQNYQKTKVCRYCEKYYLQSELRQRITIEMLIQMDRYLAHLGKDYKWLRRSDIQNVDPHCLYQEHQICQRCYRLYNQIQDLIKTEAKLLKKMGITFSKTPRQMIMNSTSSQLENQSKNKEIQGLLHDIPQKISLGPNSNILFHDGCPVRNDQIINCMLRYRLIIYLNQIDQVKGLKPQCSYTLEVIAFGLKNRFKFGPCKCNQTLIPLNKFKVDYFFTHSSESLQQYLSEAEVLMRIETQEKDGSKSCIGTLQLPLRDFPSGKKVKQNYYKFFRVRDIDFGWGLQFSIGLIPSTSQINTSKIITQSADGLIYLPSDDYYYCEALPEQWIDQIKQWSLKKKMNEIQQPQKENQQKEEAKKVEIVRKKIISWRSLLNKEINNYERIACGKR